MATGTTTHYIGDWYEVDPVAGVATVYYPFNGQAIAMKQGATLYYLHRDQVGSVVSVSSTTRTTNTPSAATTGQATATTRTAA